MTSILLVAVRLLMLCGPAVDDPGSDFQPAPSRFPYGAIDGQHLLLLEWYNVSASKEHGELRWSWCDLGTSRLRPLQEVMPKTSNTIALATHDGWPGGPEPRFHLHRWRIGQGHFWVTTSYGYRRDNGLREGVKEIPFPMETLRDGRLSPLETRPETEIPLADVDRAEITAKGVHLPFGYHDVISAERGVYREEVLVNKSISDLVLLSREEVNIHSRANAKNRWAVVRLDFDILPVARQRFKLVLLASDELSIWDYSYGLVANDANREHLEGVWQRQAVFPSPLKERFHVAAQNGVIFMVTDSGAVYAAEGVKGKWTAKEVWNKEPRPIIAMLSRSEDNGAYVFGKDFYFQLAKKIDVKPCRDVTKPDAKEKNGGLEKLQPGARLAYECGRVLYERGELKALATK